MALLTWPNPSLSFHRVCRRSKCLYASTEGSGVSAAHSVVLPWKRLRRDPRPAEAARRISAAPPQLVFRGNGDSKKDSKKCGEVRLDEHGSLSPQIWASTHVLEDDEK